MKLYSVAMSPFSARVRAAIYFGDLPIQIAAPPGGSLKSLEFLALSPFGKVPILQLADGTIIPESETIVEFLEEFFPDFTLLPGEVVDRARIRLINRVAEIYVLPAVVDLVPQMRSSTPDMDVVARAGARLGTSLQQLCSVMGSGPFAYRDAFSLADCWLVPLMFYVDMVAQSFGLIEVYLPGSVLDRYHDSISAHPVARKVLDEMEAGRIQRAREA